MSVDKYSRKFIHVLNVFQTKSFNVLFLQVFHVNSNKHSIHLLPVKPVRSNLRTQYARGSIFHSSSATSVAYDCCYFLSMFQNWQ